MKRNKSITENLNKIELIENTVEKIGKFLKTKRGTSFVSKLHTAPFRELCRRYNVPKFMLLYSNDTINLNLVKAAIKKYDIQLPTRTKTTRLEAPKQPKTAIKLTAEEHKTYNKAHSPSKMGFAALMHAYEEHKMKKFEKLHPAPTERELKEDLFPEELLRAWDTMMTIHREYVRNMLCDTYYNKGLPIFCKNRDDFYKLYVVYNKYEKEGDPYVVGYPFTDTRVWNQYTLIDKVKEKLQIKANYYCADSDAIGLRVYNKYGIPIAYSTIPRKNFEKT